MDVRSIVGILAACIGTVVTAIGLILLMTWPYPLEVLAVVGGPFLMVAGILAMRSPRPKASA